jgi:transcriptional regulator with XRE-family HTH domain
MSQAALARRSGVSERAINNFEKGLTKLLKPNREAIKQALEEAGVVFIGDSGAWLHERK